MAKISDYEKTSTISNNDSMIVETEQGTKSVLASTISENLNAISNSKMESSSSVSSTDTIAINTSSGLKKITMKEAITSVPLNSMGETLNITEGDLIFVNKNGKNNKIAASNIASYIPLATSEIKKENVSTSSSVIYRSNEGLQKIKNEHITSFLNETLDKEGSSLFSIEPRSNQSNITSIYSLIDALTPSFHWSIRKILYRGKNLGSTFTDSQKNEIRNGTFRNLFVGDYWQIDGVSYYIADFNYWDSSTISGSNKNHIVVFAIDVGKYQNSVEGKFTLKNYPLKNVAAAVDMNSYKSSKAYSHIVNNVDPYLETLFGDSLMTHRDHLTISNVGAPSYNSVRSVIEIKAAIVTEIMVYGNRIMGLGNDGVIDAKDTGDYNRMQLAIFKIDTCLRATCFCLRDRYSNKSDKGLVSYYGIPKSSSYYFTTNNSCCDLGIVFGLC